MPKTERQTKRRLGEAVVELEVFQDVVLQLETITPMKRPVREAEADMQIPSTEQLKWPRLVQLQQQLLELLSTSEISLANAADHDQSLVYERERKSLHLVSLEQQ